MHVSLKSLNSYAWSPGRPCFRQPKSFPAPSTACVPITNNKNTAMLIKIFFAIINLQKQDLQQEQSNPQYEPGEAGAQFFVPKVAYL